MMRMPGLGMPVLGVLGLEPDTMGWGTEPDDVLRCLPPGGRFVPLEGVGHFVHIEQPERVASLVLEFLGDPPPTPAGGWRDGVVAGIGPPPPRRRRPDGRCRHVQDDAAAARATPASRCTACATATATGRRRCCSCTASVSARRRQPPPYADAGPARCTGSTSPVTARRPCPPAAATRPSC